MGVHVMLDLETWGTMPGSALRSIGALVFSPYDPLCASPSFYANIERSSCEAAGLRIDPNTVDWWAQQDAEAQGALLADQRSLEEVADGFTSWWRAHDGGFIWSNGANFDEVLWRVACKAVGRDVPWKYWNVRDTRTCWHLARLNPKTIPRDGEAHNALADARHQALCVAKAYAILNVRAAA